MGRNINGKELGEGISQLKMEDTQSDGQTDMEKDTQNMQKI